MRQTAALTALLFALVGCTTDTASDVEVDPVLVDTAYDICPMLWQWQLSVGAVMNEMSLSARHESDGSARLELYLGAMDEVRDLVSGLEVDLETLGPGEFTEVVVADVQAGLDQADAAIDQAEQFVRDRHRVGSPPYGDIVPPLFLSFEKVIDLAKPEMASYGRKAMVPSFQEIPQCQFGVKDVDDGVPRYVPLTPDPTVPEAQG